MFDFSTVLLVDKKQDGFCSEVAVQLRKKNINAVVWANKSEKNFEEFITISGERCINQSLSEIKLCTNIVTFIQAKDPKHFVQNKNGILYLSRELGMEAICTIITNHSNEVVLRKAEIAATKIIRSLGVQVNICGYRYLKTAVMCCIKNPELMYTVVKLYKIVGEIYDSYYLNVERGIRTAIEMSYNRHPDMIERHFAYRTGKPSNSEVIAMIADTVRTWVL